MTCPTNSSAFCVDALDGPAPARRGAGVVERVVRIDVAPHHVLDAIGGLDHAHEEVPSPRVDPVEDRGGAIVERLVEVVHERLLVDSLLVEGPRGLGPPQRAIGADPVEQLARQRLGGGHRRGRVGRVPVDRRDVELQVRAGLDQHQLRHAVDAHQRIGREVEIDPLAPLALGQVHRLARDLDVGRAGLAVPRDRNRHPQFFVGRQRAEPFVVGVGKRRVGAQLALLLPDDRVRWPDDVGLGDVAVEDEPAQDAAKLGVAFLVAAQVRREVVERAHRPADVREGQAREQLAVRHRFRGERHGDGEDAGAHAGLARRHPEGSAAARRRQARPRDREVVEEEPRRLARHHREIGQVGLRIAHEKIVDVVLARVGARRERGPRGRGLRRMRRLETMEPALRGQLGEVGQLAGLDPPFGEFRVHAVEAQDDELLLEPLGRRGGAARPRQTCERQSGEESRHDAANYTDACAYWASTMARVASAWR